MCIQHLSPLPSTSGYGILACSFGLRYEVDADYTSAIDNVTRKSTQEGKHPVAVGAEIITWDRRQHYVREMMPASKYL
jgi:high-affinity nickel permease